MPKGRITEHFTWGEAACNCCGRWPDHDEIRATAEWMERVREVLGGRPLRINSWYRCRTHNARVGGEPNSQHLLGRAVDFTVKDLSPAAVAKLLRPHWGAGKLIRGLGQYRGFVHADRRTGRPARWRG